MVKKVIFKENKKFYWSKGDLHTNSGVLKEQDIKKGGFVKSHTGSEFLVFNSCFSDRLERIKRGPAVMSAKDVGFIIASTGVGCDSFVLDAGTGCGFTAALLARVVKRVVTYEVRKDFFELSAKNFGFLGLKNVKQRNLDVYDGIFERHLDLIVLDLAEPWRVLPHAVKALKQGCFVVAYLPTISQVSKLVSSCDGFFHDKTVELLLRDWHVEGQKLRPKSQMIAHTGFLVFLRKV